MTPKEKLEKELHRLQRDLNSHRLLDYIPGDQSEEEQNRKRERESKLALFNEILNTLHESEFEIVKVNTCECGNVLTLSAHVAGPNSTTYRIKGGINVDADNRALCACNKVHHFRAPLEKWINTHQQNRIEAMS